MWIFPAVILFGLAIIAHETGHLLVAKKKGVKIETFSVGFGPKLLGIRRGETEYTLRVIPFGGYLKMSGENPDERKGAPNEFYSKSPFARSQIVGAGPCMNLLLAYAVSVAMYAIGTPLPEYPNRVGYVTESLREKGVDTGDTIIKINQEEISNWQKFNSSLMKLAKKEEKCTATFLHDGEEIHLKDVDIMELSQLSPLLPSVVGEVTIGTPAYSAGIVEGDRILSVDGKKIEYWHELAEIIHRSAEREVELTVEREGETFPIRVKPFSQEIGGRKIGLIGIRQPVHEYSIERSGWKSIPYGTTDFIYKIGMSYQMLWTIIRHPVKFRKSLGGPILIVQMAGAEAEKGLSHFLSLMAFVNIMFAVINLVPFPVLDGGHIMFFCIEKIRGKPLTVKIQEVIQQVGIALLIAFMVFLVINDSRRLIDRMKALRETQGEK